VTGCCEKVDGTVGFLKYWEILEQLSDWCLLKKVLDPYHYY
jgi:hypothetical protein